EVNSLFDVDTVMNITNKVSEITRARYGQSHKTDVSLRVITDHIRSATMMICDGVLPSNEGRGYVLRRLLRRAARHGKLLGVNEPFLFEVCDTVISENRNAYPDLVEKQAYITKVIRTEEENFARTIDAGMKIFTEMLGDHKKKGEAVFSGADAFRLYDTYGFPIDLTVEMLEEEGMAVDQASFHGLMEEQRARARADRAAMGDLGWASVDLGLDAAPTAFTGYESLTGTGEVLAMLEDGELSSALTAGKEAVVVLDRTPFYAEMGGQVADHGTISRGESVFEVKNVQKTKGGKFLHHGVLKQGRLNVGDTVSAAVDAGRRRAIMRAHSATHLLDRALRAVLGEHVHQAGSLVEPDRLRFDFTHFAAMTAEELAQVETMVNEAVLEGYGVRVEELPIGEAKKRGAIALFGEKYGDVVRVVDMGGGYSVEFCGGTHLDNTAKVGAFAIESEFSVASGVRRIEAVTGKLCLEEMERTRAALQEAAGTLKTKPDELPGRVRAQLQELHDLRREVDAFKAKSLLGDAEGLLRGAKDVGGLKVVSAALPGEPDADAMRRTGDFLRDKEPGVVAVLASVKDGKITFLAVSGKQAVGKGVRAGEVIRAVTAVAGGSGGGKPDSAMGGGKDVSKLAEALAAVEGFVASKAK
ncbi:MAG TPA: alanine--tRNA ligase, partial [Oscillospiraceae bacterium]|nr:alanine--tRNA ligase [Oscillospiraceae bacterium]